MNVVGTLLLLCALLMSLFFLFFATLRRAGFSIICITVGIIAFFLWQDHHRNIAFESLSLGADASDVISLVGSPPRVTDGTEWVEVGLKKSKTELIPGCRKEFWYASFLYPERLSFCFSENDKLIHKYRWSSW